MQFEKIFVEQTDSTNDFANRIKDSIDLSFDKCIVVYTNYQTQGKGAGTNKWISDNAKNLLVSLLFAPNINASSQFLISKVISLALIDLLAYFSIKATIKWPNDILVDFKKIAGILIENSIVGEKINTTIAGIGLNVNQTQFIDTLKATSMAILCTETFQIENILNIFLQKFDFWFKTSENPDIIDNIYFNNLVGINDFYEYKQGDKLFYAKIENIDEFGQLILVDKNNKRYIYGFKQVEMIY